MKDRLKSSQFSRKEFMRISWIIVLLPVFWLWYSLVKRQRTTANLIEEIQIPSSLPQGLSFFDEVIAFKKDESVTFLSSRCSHLGCQIGSFENDELICPCHGSRFSVDGRNIMGPASQPLAKLSFRTDQKTGGFIVNLPIE
jgi:cytochrome b6-f complex iron-sulfur subunit